MLQAMQTSLHYDISWDCSHLRHSAATSVKVDKNGCRVEKYDGHADVAGLGSGDSYYRAGCLTDPECDQQLIAAEVE